ncbi:MAG: hypothetical protein ACLPPF_11170 [Rhodomicrobium sp.]
MNESHLRPLGATDQAAQLLVRIERVRKSTYAMRVIGDDDALDATVANALSFMADVQEADLEAIAAGVRELRNAASCPQPRE